MMNSRRPEHERLIGVLDRDQAAPKPIQKVRGARPHGASGPSSEGRDRRAEPPPRCWRVLLAHDPRAATCDALADAIADAFDEVEIVDASSMEDARVAVATETFDVCLVCLDLPPAPLGGARLANDLLADGLPVVLVTRSLRWLPTNLPALSDVPWIAPEASVAEVEQAITLAAGEVDSMIRVRSSVLEEAAEAEPTALAGRVPR